MLEEGGKPYTFLADTDLDQKLHQWRPYMLKWCLSAWPRYASEGFSNLPTSCLQWKDDLVHQHDTVKAFIDDHLMKTGLEDDFIQRSVTYDLYKTLYPEEKCKKTSLGKRRFWEQFQMHLGTAGFHDRKRKRGKGFKEIYEGWTYNNTD